MTVIAIFALMAVLACAVGAVGGYLFFRARHREAVAEIESLDQELSEREAELRRLKYQISTAHAPARPGEPSYDELRERVEALQEELEQRTLDLNILRQDYDLETRILKQEVDQMRGGQASDLKQARQQLGAERADLDALRTQLDQQQHQLREAQAQLDRQRQEHEHARQALERDRQTLERDRQTLERDRQALDQERRTFERDRREAEQAAERLNAREADLAEREARLAEQETRLAALERQLEAQQEELAEAAIRHARQAALADAATGPEAPHESLLVRRLRQQIRLQEEELAQLRSPMRQQPLRPRPGAAPEASPAEVAPSEAPPAEARAFRPEPPSGTGHGPGFPSFSPLSALLSNLRPAAPRQAGRADPLTRIHGVTDAMQAQLFEMGYTTFEQIARLTSADVRRLADRLGVDRRTIQDRWIIEAQSHVFEKQTP